MIKEEAYIFGVALGACRLSVGLGLRATGVTLLGLLSLGVNC